MKQTSIDRKEKLDLLNGQLMDWHKFKLDLLPKFLNNPDQLLKGQSLYYWMHESNKNIRLIESRIRKLKHEEASEKILPYAVVAAVLLALMLTPPGHLVGNFVKELPGRFTIDTGTGTSYFEISAEQLMQLEDQIYGTSPNRITISDENLTLVLAYQKGAAFDANDNGVELDTGAIDFTVAESTFASELPAENICTRWEITNLETGEASYECYGGADCCALLGLLPSAENWNEDYYVFKGKNSAGMSNTVGAQIVYTIPDSQVIYASQWARLRAIFMEMPAGDLNVICPSCNFTVQMPELENASNASNATILQNITEKAEGKLKIKEGREIEKVREKLGKRLEFELFQKEGKGKEAVFELEVTDKKAVKNKISFNGIDNLDDVGSIAFISQGRQWNKHLVTDIAFAEEFGISNATIRLKKHGDVDSIVQCTVFDIESNGCEEWVATEMPFIDYGDYIEFTVSHFSAYAGFSNVSVTIAGGTYSLGINMSVYSAYFKEQSSDVSTRPVAIVKEDYVLTFAPQDFIVFRPKKATAQGRLGNRVQSWAETGGLTLTYPGQYEEIGSSSPFANLTYTASTTGLEENLIIWNKDYIWNRFDSQVNPEDSEVSNIVFTNVIRVYKTDDLDNNTLGILYGRSRQSFKQFGLFADSEITTTDEVYFTDQYNRTVYYIPKLYARDTVGSEILLNKTVSMTAFGNLQIEVLTPFSWLNSTGRVYPVFIDPTIRVVLAEHLDENRSFISDVYPEVYAVDDIWSEPIYANEYVRVTFERFLNSSNDITIYPRNNESTNTSVLVYEAEGSTLIAAFPIINSTGKFKVFLENLSGEQSTFDLKVVNFDNDSSAFLEFDHIIDPTADSSLNVSLVHPQNASAVYTNVSVAANITGNLTIINATLYTNVSGTWQARETRWNGEVPYNSSGLRLLLHFNNETAFSELNSKYYDFSGNNNNATCSGSECPDFVPGGRIGGARSFYATSSTVGQYLTIPTSSTLDTTEFTIAAWIKMDDYSWLTVNYPISRTLATGSSGWAFGVMGSYASICGAVDGLVYLVNGTLASTACSASVLPVNTWVHVVFSHNGTATSVYINGTWENTTLQKFTGQNGQPINIGRRNDDFWHIRGDLDEIAIWNRSLNATEVMALYNYTKGSFNPVFANITLSQNGTYAWNIWAYDNISNDAWAASGNFTFTYLTSNNPPRMNSSRIYPSPGYAENALLGYCNGTDTPSGSVAYYYKWYLNQTVNATGNISGFTSGIEINIANISGSDTAAGQNWTLECTVFDGVYNSSPMNSTVNLIGINTWVANCKNISLPGNYYLTQNIATDAATCINVNSQDVSIDCSAYRIVGDNTSGTFGVRSTYYNTTVKNCIISNFSTGIGLFGLNNSLLENNTINISHSYGILANNSNLINITRNRITSFASAVFLNNSLSDDISHNRLENYGKENCGLPLESIEQTVVLAEDQTETFDFLEYSDGTASPRYYIYDSTANKYWDCDLDQWTSTQYFCDTGWTTSMYNGYGESFTVSNKPAGDHNIDIGFVKSTAAGWYFVDRVFRNYALNSDFDSYSGTQDDQITDDFHDWTEAGTTTIYDSHDDSGQATMMVISDGQTGDCTALPAVMFSSANSSIIWNNTFLSSEGSLVSMSTSTKLNIFYWNNFSTTSGYYVYDSGANSFNSSEAGQPIGNFWADIMGHGFDAWSSDARASPYNGLYYADSGADYPYSSSTTGKISGGIDFAPITEKLYGCAVVNYSNSAYNSTTGRYYYFVEDHIYVENMTCFTIAGSNITLECNNYNITGDSSSNTAGIFANNQSNLEIRNCNVFNFGTNIYLQDVHNSSVDNVLSSTTRSGFSAESSSYNNITRIRTIGSSGPGFTLNASNWNMLDNITANSTSQQGMYITAYSHHNIISNLESRSVSASGFHLYTGGNNTFTNINSSSYSAYATYLVAAHYNTFQNLHSYVPSIASLVLTSSSYNNFTSINASSKTNYGVLSTTSSNSNRFYYINASTVSGTALQFGSSDGNILSNSRIESNSSTAVYLSLADHGALEYVSASSATGEALIVYFSDYNNITNVTGTSGNNYGLELDRGGNNRILNSSFTGRGDIYFYSSDLSLCNNTFVNVTGTSLLPIDYYHRSGAQITQNISAAVLCDTSGINITDISIGQIFIYYSNNTRIVNTSIRSGLNALDIAFSNNNTIQDANIFSNQSSAIYLSFADYNIFNRTNATSNSSYGLYLYQSSDNNTFVNVKAESVSSYGLYVTGNQKGNYFENTTVNKDRLNTTASFYSASTLNVSSLYNTGWWPLPTASNATTQATTAYYNGTYGGLNASLNYNSSFKWWYNNNQRAPVVASSTILPYPAYDNASIIGYCSATDFDMDNLTYYYKWYLNGLLNVSGSLTNYSFCYQETANESTACGGLATGAYANSGSWTNINNTYDGSLETQGTAGVGGGTLYINYTKPVIASNLSIWQTTVRGQSPSNNSIPSDCWSIQPLQLKINASSSNGPANWYCHNSSEWVLVGGVSGSLSGRVWEESMHWAIEYGFAPGTEINVANISISQLSAGQNWTLECTAFDGTDNSTPMNSTARTIHITPAVSNVLLSSTSGMNFTTDNLTVTFNQANPGTNITDWRLNGTSIAVVNLPFDVDTRDGTSIIRDYSSFSHYATNGSSVNGSVAGIKGYALSFNGVESLGTETGVQVNRSSAMEPANALTVETWVKTNDPTLNQLILSKRYQRSSAPFNSYVLSLFGSSYWAFDLSTAAMTVRVNSTTVPSATWTHVVGTFDGTTMKIFINGVEEGSTTGFAGQTIAYSEFNLSIGDFHSSWTTVGLIDEVKIYDRALSPEQINISYQAGLAGHAVYNLSSEETEAGENWSVSVTSSDGYTGSITVSSSNMTILLPNSAPIITAVSSIGSKDPIEGSSLILGINFTAYDADGTNDINLSTANFTVNITGLTRISSGCSNLTIDETTANISCNLTMRYYDLAGIYSINVSIKDNSGAFASNATTTFTYNELSAISINLDNLDFGTVNMGQQDIPGMPIIINNTGNANFSYASLKAFDLVNLSDVIRAGNFTMNISNSSLGAGLENDTWVNISNAYLARSNDTFNSNFTLYVYADIPSTPLPAVGFKSLYSWIVTAFG